jgi:DNA-binding LacI/PurR family transcriptional regulator
MRIWLVLWAFAGVATVSATGATAQTMASMQGHRRILLIAAPNPQDPQVVTQRQILSGWRQQAADRDISVVEVSGRQVTGAADQVAALRKIYRLTPGLFQVLLIGKDGHVALRSARPVAADRLQAIIDAMPMRQAGER